MKWSYFDKFENVNKKYLPVMGEGETMATQVVTAINKLVYKWYNDGDVYDNTGMMSGWYNDLSNYANWLSKNIEGAENILDKIYKCYNDEQYELILAKLANKFLSEEFLTKINQLKKVGSIYKCDGKYEFIDNEEDEEEYYY